MIRSYVALTKPGIIFGNLVTCAAGFALAGAGGYMLLLQTLFGLACVVAAACVCNNYIDKDMDRLMARTENRPLACGSISVEAALLFATLLGAIGVFILACYTNLLATGLALFGFFIYVFIYSFMKYKTVYSTLVGSIAGAIPPVVGYTAVRAHIDSGAASIFVILLLWQMPHFYAIAMYRLEDYIKASIPVLPIIRGLYVTKVHMVMYVALFAVAVCAPTFFGYTGYTYLLVALMLASAWLYIALQGLKTIQDRAWARKMFFSSLVVVMAFSFVIPFDVIAYG